MINNAVYFENVKNIGNLFIDHIFTYFDDEPIFFVCKDNKDNLYLCLCSEIRYEQIWFISKTNISIISKLIKREIDITSSMINSDKMIKITMDIDGKEESIVVNTEDLDEFDLPEKGFKLEIDDSNYDYIRSKSQFKNKMISGSSGRLSLPFYYVDSKKLDKHYDIGNYTYMNLEDNKNKVYILKNDNKLYYNELICA